MTKPIDRSSLLGGALHRHLVRLAAEHDTHAWAEQPLTKDETAFSQIADWGAAETWPDWAEATR